MVEKVRENPTGYGIIMTASLANHWRWGGSKSEEKQELLWGVMCSDNVLEALGVDPDILEYILEHGDSNRVSQAVKAARSAVSTYQKYACHQLDKVIDALKEQGNFMKLEIAKEAIAFISSLCGFRYDYDRPDKSMGEKTVVDLESVQMLCPALSFEEQRTVCVGGDFYLPIPDGYRYSEDPAIIGDDKKIMVVPNDYPLSADYEEAPFALSVLSQKIPIGRVFDPALTNAYISIFTNKFPVFSPEIKVFVIKPRMGFCVLYQNSVDEDNPTWNEIEGLLFVGENAFAIDVIYNHELDNAEDEDLIADFCNVADSWLERIYLPGEEERITLEREVPSPKLYPHYKEIKANYSDSPGEIVVVNASGMEYEFCSLRGMSERSDTPEELKEVYRRIDAMDTGEYTLFDKAKEMQKLFHVDTSVFDPQHDRECELQEGYMHRAYMMSALRSFAWTLTDYCVKKETEIENLDYTTVHSVVKYISGNDWLNYNGDSYCRGLCCGSDLHVYFVPENVAWADKKKLLPTAEELEEARKRKESFLAYDEILQEIHSLDALRMDLAFIYPAVRTLYKHLAVTRDYSKPLLGDDADIVYAWCALALAAKEPFFSEDGPMRCCFQQIASWEELSEQGYDIDKQGVLNKYCGTAADIIIPEGVTAISNYAFYECKTLTSVVIPGSVTTIGDSAFRGCEALTSVVIPEGVTAIGESTFWGCKSLTSITIPESVKEIGSFAFLGCSSLIYIRTAKNSYAEQYCKGHNLVSICSILEDDYGVDGQGVLTIYLGSATDIVLPEGITAIGKGVFEGKEHLTSVVIPEGITAIGDHAFSGCKSLTSIVIPMGVTAIGDDAFFDCKSLTSITIPESVKEIGRLVFLGCSSLIYICTTQNSYAEQYCKEHYLVSICSILEDDFGVDGQGVLTIYLGSATDIILPEGITAIGKGVFKDNEHLTSVVIPEGVTSIGESAFWGCKSLTSIVIPMGVTVIGDDAFFSCKSLICIGAAKDSYAEQYCEENHLPFVHKILQNEYGVDEQGVLQKYFGSATDIILPEGITAIGERVFQDNERLTSVVIPEGVTSIGDHAFWGCKSLTSIVIPMGVTAIGDDAFFDCKSLTSIAIPESVKEIGSLVFLGCSSLIYIRTAKNSYAEQYCKEHYLVSICSILEDDFGVDGQGVLTAYLGSATDIILPEVVTAIGRRVFVDNEHLTSIVIPEGVTSIGESAFRGCKSLTCVVIPKGVTAIGDDAFNGCEALTSIAIPEGVTVIGDNAFNGCEALTSVVILEGVTTIGKSAFSGCKVLTAVVIPEGATAIGGSAFSGCKSLTSIAIPPSVTKIGRNAFSECDSLEVIHTPKGSYAERYCRRNRRPYDNNV